MMEKVVLNGVIQKDIDHELEYLHKNYDDTLDMDAFKTQISYLSSRMGESATEALHLWIVLYEKCLKHPVL